MCVTQLCAWQIVYSDTQLNDVSASTGQQGDRWPYVALHGPEAHSHMHSDKN